jgi:hypothetical protein
MRAGISRFDPFSDPSSSSPIFNMRVEYGGLIFLSGMADEHGEKTNYPGDYKAQSTLVLSYIDEQVLHDHGIVRRSAPSKSFV